MVESINYHTIWGQQADRLAYLFAPELGLSRDQYIDHLPQFAPQGKADKGVFDFPLLVQTATPNLTLVRICEVTGINVGSPNIDEMVDWRDDMIIKMWRDKRSDTITSATVDWSNDPKKFRTPSAPYSTWINTRIQKDNSAYQTRAGLTSQERGGTIYDGLSLLIQKPELLDREGLALPGSEYFFDFFFSDEGTVIILTQESNHKILGFGYAGLNYAGFQSKFHPPTGCLVASRKIATKRRQPPSGQKP